MAGTKSDKRKTRAGAREKGDGWLEVRNGKWLARIMIDGRIRSKSTGLPATSENRVDAEDALKAFAAQERLPEEKKELLARGRILQIDEALRSAEDAKPRLAVSEAPNAYRRTSRRRDCSEKQLEAYETVIGRFSSWLRRRHRDCVEMRAVTGAIADEYAEDLARSGMAPGTFNRHRDMLRHVWEALGKEACTSENPWGDIQKKKADVRSKRELTVEEFVRVWNSVSGEMRTLFALGIYTGQRLGDLATLSWSSVDLVRGIITLVPGKTRRFGGKKVVIPIHDALAEILSATASDKRRGHVIPETARLYAQDGTRLCGQIQRIFEEAGIRTHAPGTGKSAEARSHMKRRLTAEEKSARDRRRRAVVEVGFHSLRHTFVSMTANSGGSLGDIRSMTGHATVDMALHYFHSNAAGLKQTVAMIPDMTSGRVGTAEDAPAIPGKRTFPFLDAMPREELTALRDEIENRLRRL